jgi:Zn-dependent protease
MGILVEYLLKILIYGLPVLMAITFHEAAHGFIALKLGDDTAKQLGRVTFNPFKHIDYLGTIILPSFLLLLQSPFLVGYAKPVPVNFQRLKRPRRDMILVAAAGPITNLLLALASVFILKLSLNFIGSGMWGLQFSDSLFSLLTQSFMVSLQFNIMLAVFNMLPLLPLDGGRIIVGLLPPSLSRIFEKTERWGLLIIIGLLFIIPLLAEHLGIDFNPFASLLKPIVKVITKSLLGAV